MAMRELVYLSDQKLRQFQLDKRQTGWLDRIREIGLKGPFGSGEVKVGLDERTARSHPDLAAVLNHINRSDRPAKWYQDDQCFPGDWIAFECRLAYEIVHFRRMAREAEIALFWEPHFWAERVFREMLISKTIFLHGSVYHLSRERERPAVDGTRHLDEPISEPPDFLTFLREVSTANKETVADFQEADYAPYLDPCDQERDIFTRYGQEQDTLTRYGERLYSELHYVLGQLRREGTPPEMAAWMAGYARVTCITHEIVVASPLYVEYVPAPS